MHPPRGVASPDLIRQDFRLLDARETLRTTWEIEELLLLQSVQGHAHEGHGVFRGREFPNTTIEDVIRALRRDPLTIGAQRQALIDSINAYATAVLDGNAPPALLDGENQPLMGVSTLRFVRVDPTDVVRGLYLGGLRDESELRAEVEKERGVKIGGGRCYCVNYRRMLEMGLNGDTLARGEWAADIERFRLDGLIVERCQANDPDVVYQYIRHRRGPGHSDDAAIAAAGMLWGIGVAVGVFFADAIDTLEKYVPEYRDQDEQLSVRMETRAADFRLSREDAKTLAYLAAVPDERKDDVPDSSLRHLLSIDRQADLCAIEAHLLAVEGVPAPSIGLGHERIPSHEFYEYVHERINSK